MGKPARNASTSGSGSASVEIKAAVMEALTDSTVLATLAERVADAVFAKFEKRMSAFGSELLDKDQRIELLEKTDAYGGADRCPGTVLKADVRAD